MFNVLQELDPSDEFLELDRDRIMLGLYPKSHSMILHIVTIFKMHIHKRRIEEVDLDIGEVWRSIV